MGKIIVKVGHLYLDKLSKRGIASLMLELLVVPCAEGAKRATALKGIIGLKSGFRGLEFDYSFPY
jgi:hypothetical protein